MPFMLGLVVHAFSPPARGKQRKVVDSMETTLV